VWAATARLLGLTVTRFDRFTRGSGHMRCRRLGAVPVMAAEGRTSLAAPPAGTPVHGLLLEFLRSRQHDAALSSAD
jgi:hypothetical protein